MSKNVWSWRDAIRQSGLHPNTRLVLLTLSIYMNELGRGAFPSYQTLAEDTGLNKRTVMRHIELATEAGFLEKTRGLRENKSYTSNRYTAKYPEGVVTRVTLGSDTGDTRGSDTGVTPITLQYINTPLNNPPIPPKGVVDVPDFIDGDVWDKWIRHRKEIKKKLTPTQSEGQIKKLTRWHESGYDVNEIITTSIENGWQGLFEPKKGKDNARTPEQELHEFLAR